MQTVPSVCMFCLAKKCINIHASHAICLNCLQGYQASLNKKIEISELPDRAVLRCPAVHCRFRHIVDKGLIHWFKISLTSPKTAVHPISVEYEIEDCNDDNV